jgi:trk system potassium uptake protein TrkA
LQDKDGTEFVEICLGEGDHAVGLSIKDVARELPDDCVLVSIDRAGQVIIPHGNTILKAGDRVTAFTRVHDAEALFAILHRPNPAAP